MSHFLLHELQQARHEFQRNVLKGKRIELNCLQCKHGKANFEPNRLSRSVQIVDPPQFSFVGLPIPPAVAGWFWNESIPWEADLQPSLVRSHSHSHSCNGNYLCTWLNEARVGPWRRVEREIDGERTKKNKWDWWGSSKNISTLIQIIFFIFK